MLDDIIDASTDSTVSTPDLLRKVQVVAHRAGAADIAAWVRQELSGYAPDAELPAYRVLDTNVMGTFAGFMQSFRTYPLTVMPPGMADRWKAELREPLVEIQMLSEGSGDASRPWSVADVKRYSDSGAFTIEMHELYQAANVITRQSLRGLVDVVRSKALEFALELQTAFPDAGTVGGPTVSSEPALAAVVYNITNHITGDGTNIAAGSHIVQRSQVRKGDPESLRVAAEALGLSAETAREFVDAVESDGGVDGDRTSRFLERVRSGAIVVAGSVASDVVAGSLIELGKAFLGI